MFYNHEVLTSRKYGVATVWLVATCGSKSHVKKVNKKAICGVDIPNACNVIIQPEAPMALRLQSNLLFGVSKVYDQQCAYVLLDAENLRTRMQSFTQSARDTASNALDPNAGRIRPDRLVIPDDPNFLPDLAFMDLNLDLDTALGNMNIGNDDDSSQLESVLSPHGSKSSRTSRGSTPSLHIPTSASAGGGGLGGFAGNEISDVESIGNRSRLSVLARDAVKQFQYDGGYLPEDDFAFDAEGNLVEFDRSTGPRLDVDRRRGASEAASIEEQVRRQHEDALLAQQTQMQEYDQDPIPFLEDDNQQLGPASPFPTGQPQDGTQAAGTEAAPNSPHPSQQSAHSSATSSYVTAPQRQKRAKPVPRPDNTTEFRGQEFRRLQDDYLARMATETKAVMLSKAKTQAKKNAEYYVWGQGIGGTGQNYLDAGLVDPFAFFFGERLRDMVLGITHPAGTKHARAEESGAETADHADARRVRARSSQASDADVEHARGDGRLGDEQEEMPALYEDNDEIEVGRNAPTPLRDDPGNESTLMPWNLSATHSRAGSLAASGLRTARHSSLKVRRRTSASPLVDLGRGGMSSLGMSGGGDGFGGDFGGDEGAWDDDMLPSLPPASSSKKIEGVRTSQWELLGPAALVDTQTANSASWMRKTLDEEAGNFLGFVEGRLFAGVGGEEDDETEMREILFEALLAPKEHSRVVAAQAFLHCLTLASRGIMSVTEERDGLVLGVRLGWGARRDEAVDEEDEEFVDIDEQV